MRDKLTTLTAILDNLELAREPLRDAFADAALDDGLAALIARGREYLRAASEHVERCIARHNLSDQPLQPGSALAMVAAEEWGEKRNWLDVGDAAQGDAE